MRQNFMIVNNKRYEQGTIFVTQYHNGIALTERRMTFMFYDTNTSNYWFITPNNASLDTTTIFPDTRFINSTIKTDKPTDTELKILHNKLSRMPTKEYTKTQIKNKTDFDEFFGKHEFIIRFLLITLTMLFPPFGIVLLAIAFSKKKNRSRYRFYIGAGNNPMVGMTVACAVAIEEACK